MTFLLFCGILRTVAEIRQASDFQKRGKTGRAGFARVNIIVTGHASASNR